MTGKFSSKRPLTKEEEAEIQRMIASDPDSPEATDEQIKQAKSFREALPDLAASVDREKARRGRPPIDAPKVAVTLRLDPVVLARFKATGDDWRNMISDVLSKAAKAL